MKAQKNQLTKNNSKTVWIRFSIITAAVLILTHCTVISFYPLYTNDELVRDDRIIGKWMSQLIDEEKSSDSLIWEIHFDEKKWKKKMNNPMDRGSEEIPNLMQYTLLIYPADDIHDKVEFSIHIVKLEDNLYLDFLLEDINSDNILMNMHLLPVHTFAKLEIKNEITIKWLDGDFLEDLLKNNKIRIRHEQRSDVSLLTAKPKELQKFIIKYSDYKDAYLDDLSFILSKMKEEN